MKARENPFASDRIERLAYRFTPGESWDSLLARLEAQRWRGAIVGPHGTGKTTLLEQMVPHLSTRGFCPCLYTLRGESSNDEKQALLSNSFGPSDFVLLDGAEQLSLRQWRTFEEISRLAAGGVVTQHRTGRWPTLLETAPSPALLAELVQTLAGAELSDADTLFSRHRSNLRECLRTLYDRWADGRFALGQRSPRGHAFRP